MSGIDTSITHITPAGGNIFSDLGFDQQTASKLKIKAQLMIQISEWVKKEDLKQEDVAKLLQVTRPRVSDIMRGKTEKFTVDSLIDILEKTGRRVTVQIS